MNSMDHDIKAPTAICAHIGHHTSQIPIHVQLANNSQSNTSTRMPSLTTPDPISHDNTLATPTGDDIAKTNHVTSFLLDRGSELGPEEPVLNVLGGTKSDLGAGGGTAVEAGGEQMRIGGTSRTESRVA